MLAYEQLQEIAFGYIADLNQHREMLEARLAQLEERLRTESSNSSKPPSSDGPGVTPPSRPPAAPSRGALPPGVSAAMLGPRAQAPTGALVGQFKMSHRDVVMFFTTVLGVTMSAGTVSRMLFRVLEAVAASVQAA